MLTQEHVPTKNVKEQMLLKKKVNDSRLKKTRCENNIEKQLKLIMAVYFKIVITQNKIVIS